MTLQAKATLFKDIKALLHNARTQVVRTVNSAMVNTYFEIGKLIVEHEQKGHDKALYGEETLKELSNQLSVEFGKGFSITNIQQMRSFYLAYGKQQTLSVKSQKGQTQSAKFTLSKSLYLFLMRLDARERNFYEIESTQNHWSLREL